MNKDIIAGNWKQLKGKAQAKWGDLTDDVFDVAEGNSEYLSGKLQEQYGWQRDRADKEVSDFRNTRNSSARIRYRLKRKPGACAGLFHGSSPI